MLMPSESNYSPHKIIKIETSKFEYIIINLCFDYLMKKGNISKLKKKGDILL